MLVCYNSHKADYNCYHSRGFYQSHDTGSQLQISNHSTSMTRSHDKVDVDAVSRRYMYKMSLLTCCTPLTRCHCICARINQHVHVLRSLQLHITFVIKKTILVYHNVTVTLSSVLQSKAWLIRITYCKCLCVCVYVCVCNHFLCTKYLQKL